MNFLGLFAAIIVGTWNGNWFPSGRAEHRANPKVEEATITAAAEMLSVGMEELDHGKTNDVILVLNEMRSPEVVSNLVEKMSRKDLHVASVSRYRRRDRFDQQQDAIVTNLSVVESGWGVWPKVKGVKPPRGSAFANLLVDNLHTVEVYAVHLKSNYGATTESIKADNALKRRIAIDDLISRAGSKRRAKIPLMIIAGDMNADRDRKEFAAESIFTDLEKAGFRDLSRYMPEIKRYTHPSKRWGSSLLDYVFARGFEVEGEPITVSSEDLSDHDAFFGIIYLK